MENREKEGLTVPLGNGSRMTERITEERMKSVHEVCQSYGITKKTLFYYDKIGLLKPSSRVGVQNQKMYDKRKLVRLETIIQYRQAGLQLLEIQSILDNPSCAIEDVLEKNIQRLERKQEIITKQIKLAKRMKTKEMNGRKK